MDDKLITFMIQTMQQNKGDLEKRLDHIDSKIETLVEFKWKLLGVATGASAVVSVLFYLLEMTFRKA